MPSARYLPTNSSNSVAIYHHFLAKLSIFTLLFAISTLLSAVYTLLFNVRNNHPHPSPFLPVAALAAFLIDKAHPLQSLTIFANDWPTRTSP